MVKLAYQEIFVKTNVSAINTPIIDSLWLIFLARSIDVTVQVNECKRLPLHFANP